MTISAMIDGRAQGGTTNVPTSMTDWLGMLASVGCAIHCAAMPLVISFLPMLGLSFLADESFHKVMVGVCLLIAVAAFVPGWRRHRRWLPLAIASVGLTMIATAAFALEGTCCSGCALPAETTALNTTVVSVSGESVNDPGQFVCTDACCELCHEEAGDDSSAIGSSDATTSFATSWLMWITPLGGLVLVTAHLINHRFVCRCGCCPSEPVLEGASE